MERYFEVRYKNGMKYASEMIKNPAAAGFF